MGRARSGSPKRRRSRSRSRSRDRRDRDKDRRDRERDRKDKDRDHKQKDRSNKERSHKDNKDKDKGRAIGLKEKCSEDKFCSKNNEREPTRDAGEATAPPAEESAAEKKRRRLEAWKLQQAAAEEAPAPSASLAQDGAQRFTPVCDPEVERAERAATTAAAFREAALEDLKANAERSSTWRPGTGTIDDDEDKAAGGVGQVESEEEVDPLDAFMATTVDPEVEKGKQAALRAVMEARLERAKELAAGAAKKTEGDMDSDSEGEPEPDATITLPTKKVKLIIGKGGETIGMIQKKSKARLQVKKTDDMIYGAAHAFGAGSQPQEKKEAPEETTIEFFGAPDEVEKAKKLIEEVFAQAEVAKKEQKVAEAEWKKKKKQRERHLYHLRHARDYEALGVPLGTPKIDVKKAYRLLAKKWHPDKHQGEAAKETARIKFQEIQQAYDSLMTTDEEATIEALGAAKKK